MSWLSIIVRPVSHFLSSKSDASRGRAALIVTGAALGTYYLADPANPVKGGLVCHGCQ